MRLFRRGDGSTMKFNIVGLRESELERIKVMVERNGGEVENNDEQPVKFTHRYSFVTQAFPSAKLYRVQFIKDCIANGAIIDASPYRIGTPMLYDNCVMSHFLYGSCECYVTQPRMPVIVLQSESQSERERTIPTTDVASDIESQRQSSSTELNLFHRYPNAREVFLHERRRRHRRRREARGNLRDEIPNLMHHNLNGLENLVRAIQRRRRINRGERRRGPNITPEEEMQMLAYILRNDHVRNPLNGLWVWEEMINNNICANRTPRSLYTHFHYLMCPEFEAMANER